MGLFIMNSMLTKTHSGTRVGIVQLLPQLCILVVQGLHLSHNLLQLLVPAAIMALHASLAQSFIQGACIQKTK
jgi:hypothetical protein